LRLPRLKFTVRRLMVTVAIVGVLIGLWVLKKRRDERLERREYYSRWARKYQARQRDSFPTPLNEANLVRLDRFLAMERKWEHGVRHPWLSVVPDLPEQE
jgi:hypothetical protein